MSVDPFGGFGRDFDDLFARFFGEDPFGGRRPAVQRVDVWRLLDDGARELLSRAARAAADWGSPDLDVEHLLWAATQLPVTRQMLERAGVAVDELADEMERAVEHGEPRESAPPLTPAAKRALQDAHRQARASGSASIGAEHVLVGLAANPETRAAQALARALPDTERLQGGAAGTRTTGRGTSKTPVLDEHSRDLTAAAREGRLDPVVGRESEIEQTIEVLSRRTKNNPVLLGDPGVGKTAIVEGIAQRIVNGDVPQTLADKRVVALDLSGMVGGTKYRGSSKSASRASSTRSGSTPTS